MPADAEEEDDKVPLSAPTQLCRNAQWWSVLSTHTDTCCSGGPLLQVVADVAPRQAPAPTRRGPRRRDRAEPPRPPSFVHRGRRPAAASPRAGTSPSPSPTGAPRPSTRAARAARRSPCASLPAPSMRLSRRLDAVDATLKAKAPQKPTPRPRGHRQKKQARPDDANERRGDGVRDSRK